jgi:hypothetical protein
MELSLICIFRASFKTMKLLIQKKKTIDINNPNSDFFEGPQKAE